MRPVAKIAPLVFVSGGCALVYQVAWLRELRLVFGASTGASAAVLAIFMGGLGAGGLLLGRRADRHATPLLLYARLELLVALTAALSPLLVVAVRRLYIQLAIVADVARLGTLLRLVLAALVLAPPTVLMGGTLPAAARAAVRRDDLARRDLAVLYGVNTLGAVLGSSLATFVLLEFFGTRLTIWVACLTNLLVVIAARAAAQEVGRQAAVEGEGDAPAGAPRRFVLVAAGVVGFAFVLMELVWYRMLAPVLGGSSYTFGIILAVALFGVGLGGAARAALGSSAPSTLRGFALTAALEALALAVPYALGDRIAILALLLRPLGGVGLTGLAAGWTVVASIVILPAAFVSGWQFPLLVSLLGAGGRGVGRDVSLAYAWNTAGAIVGSLAGGFGLLPALTAPGVWRVTTVLLAAVGLAAALLPAARRGRLWILGAVLPASAAVAAVVVMSASRGPTAAWRHSAVGAGREANVAARATPRSLTDWVHLRRREVAWEADGVESSVAMTQLDGYSFLVNGKVDGHLRGDASTQVMGGLLGALLHPRATRALVIGLGTGSSAGWLAAVPSMERVDVVELEPAIVRVARDAAPINHGALDNPKLHLAFGDGREALLVSRARYDVIFSEPSNPYRAGVSSLFTREFYQAAAARLADGGIFLQWLQAYEVDQQAVRTAYATIGSVFREVETWTAAPGDLILVASQAPLRHDLAALRARVASEPYRSALSHAWLVTDVEGLLAHHLARSTFARALAESEGEYLNTDDRNLLEFAFARSTGKPAAVDEELRLMARIREEERPEVEGEVDWESVEEQRTAFAISEGRETNAPAGASPDRLRRGEALMRYALRDMVGVVATWRSQPRAPSTIFACEALGEALAELGDEGAVPVIERLRASEPIEADALQARLLLRRQRYEEAADVLVGALERYQQDPWPDMDIMRRALLEVGVHLSMRAEIAWRLFRVLKRPFALRMLEQDRLRLRLELAHQLDFEALCVEALSPYEPDVPWNDKMLRMRVRCYAAARHPLAERAERELGQYTEQEGRRLSTGIVPGAD